MREDSGENKDLETVKGKLGVNKVLIHQSFSEYRKKKDELASIEADMLSIGSKDGIIQEINKIEENISAIKITIKDGLSEEETEKYRNDNFRLSELRKQAKNLGTIVETLEELKEQELFYDTSFPFSSIMDDALRNRICNEYKAMKEELRMRWANFIGGIIQEYKTSIAQNEYQTQLILHDDVYVKANAIYQENTRLSEENKKLDKEKGRLSQIDALADRICKIKRDIENTVDQILLYYNEFYLAQTAYCAPHVIKKGDVTITPVVIFQETQYMQHISRQFDGRSSKNSEVLNFKYSNQSAFEKYCKKILDKILKGEYVLKGGISSIDVAEDIFSFNPFEIEYNINYQGDDLSQMSEGKSAFVILRLLLDFSKNEYPILIDQPEDDLDNRAIFVDLVQYLREKKTHRQIILVTHNPNIVVGADAEQIIVANQRGIGNTNPDNVKFAYKSGALENSYTNSKSEILLRQGIREHVCDLLEGGDKAFQLREQKYQLSKK